MVDENGATLQTRQEVHCHLVRSFQTLYTKDNALRPPTKLHSNHSRLTMTEADLIARTPSDLEIRRTVFAMHSGKTPGPDGWQAELLKTLWPVLGADWILTCQAIWSTSSIPEPLT